MRNPKDNPAPAASREAFTLIEMLAVLTIVVILAALVVGVGKSVFDSGKTKLTEQTQASVMQAIEKYRSSTGSYPSKSDDDDCASLITTLKANPGSRAMLAGLPKDVLLPDSGTLVDGWGTGMKFTQSGGLADGPLILSAGADKTFETDDDIRSDKR